MALHSDEQLPAICLPEITLGSGNHPSRQDGVCVMEAAAWMAGEPHSDAPQCVSPVIAAFLRRWNDALPSNDERDRLLKPLIPALLETRSTAAVDERRAWRVLDWLVRTHTPAWFDLVPALSEAGAALRQLPSLTDARTARQAQPTIRSARERADAAYGAAYDAALSAARGAALGAAYAACDAALSAADAAYDAALSAADAAYAAYDAARKVLAPTAAALQESAQDLVRELCAMRPETDAYALAKADEGEVP